MVSLENSAACSMSKRAIGLAINGQRGLSILQALIGSSDYQISWILIPNTFQIGNETQSRLPKSVSLFRIKNLADLSGISASIASVDFLVCAGFPLKLPKNVLAKVRNVGINCHGGKLPSYRGGSPLMWQVINDEKLISLTIHELTSEFDEGDVLIESSFVNNKALYINEIQEIANQEFVRMIKIFFSNPEQFVAKKIAQSSSNARYWHQRSEADGFIDWQRMNANKVYNFVRAISTPYPGAHCVLGDHALMRIWRVEIDVVPICGSPGRVVKLNDGFHVTACDDSSVRLVKFDCSRKLKNGEYILNQRVRVL